MDFNSKCKTIISQALVVMMGMMFMSVISGLVISGINHDFSYAADHLQNSGLMFVVIVVSIITLILLTINILEHIIYKRIIQILIILLSLIEGYHQFSHIVFGGGATLNTTFDCFFVLSGIMAVIYSGKWIKNGRILKTEVKNDKK